MDYKSITGKDPKPINKSTPKDIRLQKQKEHDDQLIKIKEEIKKAVIWRQTEIIYHHMLPNVSKTLVKEGFTVEKCDNRKAVKSSKVAWECNNKELYPIINSFIELIKYIDKTFTSVKEKAIYVEKFYKEYLLEYYTYIGPDGIFSADEKLSTKDVWWCWNSYEKYPKHSHLLIKYWLDNFGNRLGVNDYPFNIEWTDEQFDYVYGDIKPDGRDIKLLDNLFYVDMFGGCSDRRAYLFSKYYEKVSNIWTSQYDSNYLEYLFQNYKISASLLSNFYNAEIIPFTNRFLWVILHSLSWNWDRSFRLEKFDEFDPYFIYNDRKLIDLFVDCFIKKEDNRKDLVAVMIAFIKNGARKEIDANLRNLDIAVKLLYPRDVDEFKLGGVKSRSSVYHGYAGDNEHPTTYIFNTGDIIDRN